MKRKLFKNGFLFTHEGTFFRGALLVEGDRISAVYREGETPLLDESGSDEVFDLAGAYVLPGFVDAHFHIRSLALKSLRCDLGEANSVEEVLDNFIKWSRSQDTPFLVGVDWDESRWPERSFPTRDLLDSVETERPVFLRRICGHIGVVNGAFSRLLEAEGIPVDAATGLIEEDAVWAAGRMSSPDPTKIAKSFKGAVEKLHSLGITGIHDIIEPHRFDTYLQGIREAGPLRIKGFIVTEPNELDVYRMASKSMDREFFEIAGVKIFLDGSLGGWTAALNEPYNDSPRTGELLVSEDRLERVFKECYENEYTCAAHAIGDKALVTALRLLAEFPGSARCFRIEHAEIIGPQELDLLEKAPVYIVMQPNFMRNWGGPGGLYDQRLGRERYRVCNRFRTLSEANIGYCFSSDGMPPGPLYGLKGATDHPLPEERIPPGEALLRYTTASHRLGLANKDEGVLDSGKKADLVVLSGNPIEADPDDISVEKTYVAGECVYDGKTSSGRSAV